MTDPDPAFTFTSQYTWTDILGNTFHPKPDSAIAGNGAVSMTGALPVNPAPAGTEVDLNFAPMGITSGIVFLWLENRTGQELNMAWQGNWFPHLPPGGRLIWAFPVEAAAGQITAMRFMLTQDQSSLGYIKFMVVGS